MEAIREQLGLVFGFITIRLIWWSTCLVWGSSGHCHHPEVTILLNFFVPNPLANLTGLATAS